MEDKERYPLMVSRSAVISSFADLNTFSAQATDEIVRHSNVQLLYVLLSVSYKLAVMSAKAA